MAESKTESKTESATVGSKAEAKTGSARAAAGMCALLAGMLCMAGCAMKETATGSGDTAGVVVNVADSSNVVISFDDASKTVFTDSGSFDLDDIRRKMSDKGLDPDAIDITGIVVTYDDSTKAFLAANAGVKFVLKIYVREEGSGDRRLAMETLEKDTLDFSALSFDPEMAVLILGKHIFANPDGFPYLLTAIKDESKHAAWLIAEMTVPGTLKSPGALKVSMVVTIAGKV